MVSLIVAMTENRVIGRDGDMPWRLSADLKRFKRITMGHHMIMGRKTFDSIGRTLPGRTTIVLSRAAKYEDPKVKVARSLDEAFSLAAADNEVFIVGGAQIYELALPRVHRIYLTQVHCTLEGDTLFPEVNWEQWQLVDQEDYPADDKNNHDYSFFTYERREFDV